MKRTSFAALAFAALAFTACDSADRSFGPAYDYSMGTNSVGGTSAGISQSGTAVISTSGGTVTAGAHTLTVAPGAVREPTLFLMSVVGSNAHVKLQAFQGNKWKVEVHYFSAPVTLTLSYANGYFGDPSRLSVVYMVDGTEAGPLEYIGSTVNTTNQTITAVLPHFSDYGYATN